MTRKKFSFGKNLVMKIKLFSLLLLGLFSGAYGQDARVQVVHNCADALASEVDIYVNGVLTIDDAPFRTASPFSDVPTGLPAIVSIAPGDSESVLDAFYSEQFSLEAGESYLMIAGGIESGSGYDPSPPFSIEVYTGAREAAQDPAKIDVLVYHGSTDAPTVDVVETGQGLGTVVDNISYTDYEGYLEVDPLDYVLEVRDAAGGTVLKSYDAPLSTLNLQGAAITIIASGFFDPSQNSNGPEFGLFALSPLGGPLLPLPETGLGNTSFKQLELTVYPNPAGDHIRVELEGNNNPLNLTVYDSKGAVVLTDVLDAGQPLDLSSLPAAVYTLQAVNVDNTAFTRRIIKK